MAKVLKYATVLGASASLAPLSAKFSSSSSVSLIVTRNSLLRSPSVTPRLSLSLISIRCQRTDNNLTTGRDVTITLSNEEIQKLKASIHLVSKLLDEISSTPKLPSKDLASKDSDETSSTVTVGMFDRSSIE